MNNENIPETDMEAGLFMRYSSDENMKNARYLTVGRTKWLAVVDLSEPLIIDRRSLLC